MTNFRKRLFFIVLSIVCTIFFILAQHTSDTPSKFGAISFFGDVPDWDGLSTSLFAAFTKQKVDVEVDGHSIVFNTKMKKKTPDRLRIHLVFHSHVDPGWLRSFEEYYTEQTKDIISSAVEALTKYPQLRFIWSETSFLERWWRDATEKQKTDIKRHIASGHLEISGGAWVMTDEATPLFYAAIENMIEGHQFIHETFGITPNTSWSVDPFGHGSMMPHLLPLAGVNHMVIGRFHDHVKEHLRTNQTMRWRWQELYTQESSTGPVVNSLPYFVYTTESACPDISVCKCFHVGPSSRAGCARGVKLSEIDEVNVAQLAKSFVEQIREVQKLYGTEDHLVAVGDDFYFREIGDFDQMFKGFAKMANYVEQHKELNVEIRFSTVSEFFNSIKGVPLPSLRGDFFPYTSNMHKPAPWWTGYFTHRPYSKRMERVLQHSLRSLDLVRVMGGVGGNMTSLRNAKRDLALFQHHDGITGTSKPHVMEDYEKRMTAAFQVFKANFPAITGDHSAVMVRTTLNENAAILPLLKNKKLFLSVFNSHTAVSNEIIEFCADSAASIKLDGTSLPVQVNRKEDVYWIRFRAALPALSTTVFEVEESTVSSIGETVNKPINSEMSNDPGNIRFGPPDLLQSLNISFYTVLDTGGAYVFSPATTLNTLIINQIIEEKGSVFNRTTYRMKASPLEVIISTSDTSSVDVEVHTAMPDDHSLLMRIESEIQSTSFHTDVNGLFHTKRTYQSTMDGQNLPFEANFYPAASSVFLQDRTHRMTVFTGQPNAVCSQSAGRLDVLVDRRVKGDDGKGLGYNDAYDNRTSTVHFKILIEERHGMESASVLSPSNSIRGTKQMHQVLYPGILMYSKTEVKSRSLLTFEWPLGVQLVSWRPLNEQQSLLVLRRIVYDDTIGAEGQEGGNLRDLYTYISSRSPSIFRHTSLSGTIDGTKVTVESFERSLGKPFSISTFKTQMNLV